MSTSPISALSALAREAGAVLLRYYDTALTVERKADQSPVTEADHAANRVIVDTLRRWEPVYPIVSEEGGTHPYDRPMTARHFWLVDPLDGTKSFIRRQGEFTVNIALVEDGHPVLGVVYVPVTQRLYTGDVAAGRATLGVAGGETRSIHTRPAPPEGLDVVMSRSHGVDQTEHFLKGLAVRNTVSAASSLKFCTVAEGKADLYPRFGTTMEWDTAAGHAVLLAAGGRVVTPEGMPFLYGKADFRNGYFVAWGG